MEKSKRLELIQLSTGYASKKERSVLTKQLNACLYNGQLTCLLGPNGAGKSTLLKTIATLLPPLDGDIRVNGKSIKEMTDKEMARNQGLVLTDRLKIWNLSVTELVKMGRSPYTGFWGRLTLHDQAVVKDAMKKVGIESLQERMLHTLSDGERQKVMIAKVVAQETPIILMDEPTAFLDYPSKVELMRLLIHLTRKQNKTILLSTHDLELALQVADQIWLLDKNIGLTIGTPEDLALKGQLERYFHRPGISFDIQSGLFHIENVVTHHVSLQGEGVHYQMVRKALLRRGIATDGDPSSTVSIQVENGTYQMADRRFTSIEDLLDAVSNTLFS